MSRLGRRQQECRPSHQPNTREIETRVRINGSSAVPWITGTVRYRRDGQSREIGELQRAYKYWENNGERTMGTGMGQTMGTRTIAAEGGIGYRAWIRDKPGHVMRRAGDETMGACDRCDARMEVRRVERNGAIRDNSAS